jgi:hypothetical protein
MGDQSQPTVPTTVRGLLAQVAGRAGNQHLLRRFYRCSILRVRFNLCDWLVERERLLAAGTINPVDVGRNSLLGDIFTEPAVGATDFHDFSRLVNVLCN